MFPPVMLLSREVLPDFAIISLSLSIPFLVLHKFSGKGIGNIQCVGPVGVLHGQWLVDTSAGANGKQVH
jgi:hypothetical protein